MRFNVKHEHQLGVISSVHNGYYNHILVPAKAIVKYNTLQSFCGSETNNLIVSLIKSESFQLTLFDEITCTPPAKILSVCLFMRV